jgi:hypothetical protein
MDHTTIGNHSLVQYMLFWGHIRPKHPLWVATLCLERVQMMPVQQQQPGQFEYSLVSRFVRSYYERQSSIGAVDCPRGTTFSRNIHFARRRSASVTNGNPVNSIIALLVSKMNHIQEAIVNMCSRLLFWGHTWPQHPFRVVTLYLAWVQMLTVPHQQPGHFEYKFVSRFIRPYYERQS